MALKYFHSWRALNPLPAVRAWFQNHAFLSAFVCGAFGALAMAPFYLFPLMAVSLGGLCTILRHRETGKDFFFIGFLWGLGYFLFGLYWISVALHVDIARYWWAVPLALVALPAALSLFTAVALYFLKHIKTNNIYMHALSVACLLSLSELARGYLFTGFPWNMIGHMWGFYAPIMQIASVIGVYGFSFLCLIAFCFMVNKRGALIGLFILGSLVSYGQNRMSAHDDLQTTDTLVTVVQPNIPQIKKWDPALTESHLDTLISMSRFNPAETLPAHKKHIIIWPETALTFFPDQHPARMERVASLIQDPNTLLIVGGVDRAMKNGKTAIYNAVFFIYMDEGGAITSQSYNKSHLVPFGEYIPFKQYIPFLPLGDIGFTAGDGLRSMMTETDFPNIMPLICYEAIFPEEIDVKTNHPDVFINLTNDAWYKKSSGPFQHHDMIKFRSIENGTPLIRVANTGFSSQITALGQVQSITRLEKQEKLRFLLLKGLQNANIYATYGDRIYYCMLIVSLIGLFLLSALSSAKSKPIKKDHM